MSVSRSSSEFLAHVDRARAEADLAMRYGRSERALEIMKTMIADIIQRLKEKKSDDNASMLKELARTSMTRAESLKVQVAARPRGVGGAMDLLATALSHIVTAVMRKVTGGEWKQDDRYRDLSGWLKTLVSSWDRLPWKDRRDPGSAFTRTLAFETKHWRNMWAHQKLRGPEDSFRAIDTVERLLRGLGAKVPIAAQYADDCERFFKPAALAAMMTKRT
eukprot:g2513.t1